MPLSPENEKRLKRVALSATFIALGSVVLMENKKIGDKIRHTSVWGKTPKPESLIAGLIKAGRDIRISGLLVRDSNNDVTDVVLDPEHEITDEDILEIERAFLENDHAAEA